MRTCQEKQVSQIIKVVTIPDPEAQRGLPKYATTTPAYASSIYAHPGKYLGAQRCVAMDNGMIAAYPCVPAARTQTVLLQQALQKQIRVWAACQLRAAAEGIGTSAMIVVKAQCKGCLCCKLGQQINFYPYRWLQNLPCAHIADDVTRKRQSLDWRNGTTHDQKRLPDAIQRQLRFHPHTSWYAGAIF